MVPSLTILCTAKYDFKFLVVMKCCGRLLAKMKNDGNDFGRSRYCKKGRYVSRSNVI